MESCPAPLPLQPQEAKMLIFVIITTLGHFPSGWALAEITAEFLPLRACGQTQLSKLPYMFLQLLPSSISMENMRSSDFFHLTSLKAILYKI